MIVALDLFSLNPPVTDRAHTHTNIISILFESKRIPNMYIGERYELF